MSRFLFWVWSRVDEKTIVPPSGDQAGLRSTSWWVKSNTLAGLPLSLTTRSPSSGVPPLGLKGGLLST